MKRTIVITAAAAVLAAGGAGAAAAAGAGPFSDDDALTGAALDRASEAALAETGGGRVVDAERKDAGGYDVEVRLDDGSDVDVRLDGDFGVVGRDVDGADRSDDRALTGAALDRASEAALAETGGGRVTGTEVGDEDSRYEVEVTLDDGRQVDVQLDEAFAVVGTDTDREAPGDD